MQAHIYKITNRENGQIYIGKCHSSLRAYFNDKVRRAENGLRDCVYLARAIRKYGREAFVVESILHFPDGVDDKTLGRLERYYIKEFRSQIPSVGYNIAGGGEGGSGPVSLERREKLRADKTGLKASPETCEKLRLASTGRKHSAKSKQKIARARLGHTKSVETTQLISAARRRELDDPEHRAKAVARLYISTHTAAARENSSLASKKKAANWTPAYRSWSARKASCKRWSKPFNEPRPDMYVDQEIQNGR